jgi:Ser/Thr protein kinase RdoA (MazF antagonist)
MRGQVARLRPLALEACRRFGIEPESLRLVFHGFNTTFRVLSPDGRVFALRINIGSESSLDQLNAEIAWIRILRSEGRVGVAEAAFTPDGAYIVSLDGPLGKPVRCVLFSWLDGTLAKKAATPDTCRKLGGATAELHDQARKWRIPEGCRFKALPDLLYGHDFVLPETDLFLAARDRAIEQFARLAPQPRLPIHYDLHLGNAKVNRGKLSVFDFDDAVLAWPILDAVVTIHGLRGFQNRELLERAYWEGLGSRPADFGYTDSEFEGLVASRGLFIANALSTSVHAQFRAQLPRLLELTALRLARFERLGIYAG